MTQLNTIGVDLAKSVIQVSVVTPHGKELSNKSLTRKKFAEFLTTQRDSLVAFESCATAHHWARYAKQAGHQVRILPAIAVAPFRQGHKTDQNDALAVAETAKRPNIAYIGLTPKQYSSGGKTNLIGISRYVANKRLRAILVQGARAYINRVKDPQTPKRCVYIVGSEIASPIRSRTYLRVLF